MIDILRPEGYSDSVRHVVSDLAQNELVGRLVSVLVDKGTLTADDLRRILPVGYEVRE